LITPALGVATATTVNKLTITTPATGATLTITDGKTLSISNTLTFTGTDASSVAFGTGGTVVYTGVTSLSSLTTASSLSSIGTISTGVWQGTTIAVAYGGTGVTTSTGTGNNVLSASPTFTGTPTLPTGTIATTQSASDNSTKIATTAYSDAAATAAKVLVGYGISKVTTYTAYTGITTIPMDNTIPQKTEGVQWGSITYTPASASNRLLIRATVNVGETSNTENNFVQTICQDTTSNSLVATVTGVPPQPAISYPIILITEHEMTAGTTSATTFKALVSGDVGTTLEINGNGGSRLFGGVMESKIEVWEFAP